MKSYKQNHLEALLMILIAANMFDYECEYSIEGNKVILNLRWYSSTDKLNIQNDDCWKVIPERYLK